LFERPRAGERAVLVRLGIGAPADPEDILEFEALTRSAGAVPVMSIGGRRDRPDPRFFVGTGKADEIRAAALEHNADVVLFDHPLSPSQERNLEKLIERRVLDRSGLILDIFAQRARSHEGKLEVELAQLKHIASRLVRGWTHLERQRGGGIGNRGPGETQLETDRRLLGKRVKTLTARLEKIKQQRETGRQQRAEVPVPSLALVGYTNAVGFIRELPHELVAAFQSTLTEAREATLLLHVVDVSDPRRDEHIDEVNRVLAEIGAQDLPQILVFNKIDRLESQPRVDRDEAGQISHVWLSAARSQGLDLLREAVNERLARVARRVTLRLAVYSGEVRARLYAANLVQAERITEDGAFEIDTELAEVELLKWAREPGVEVLTLEGGATCTAASGYLQSTPALRAGK
jgi:GTP-binding protein HflX